MSWQLVHYELSLNKNSRLMQEFKKENPVRCSKAYSIRDLLTNQKNLYPLDRLELDLVEFWLLFLLVFDLVLADDDFLLFWVTLRCFVFCDVALVYTRDLVAFGFLTEGLFLVSFLLDTEERVLVTLSRVFLVGVALFERFVLLVSVALMFVLVVELVLLVVRVGVVTLVLELVGVAFSEIRPVLVLVDAFVLRVALVEAELLPLNPVALVLAIAALLLCTRVLRLLSLLFLGVCA
jgi:hypothetical protein